jgi:hypothetical protein
MSLPLGELRFVRSGADGEEGADCTRETLEKLQRLCPELLQGVQARVDVFPRHQGGPEAMAKRFGVPFLGRVPLDKALQRACEDGSPGLLSGSSARGPLRAICEKVVAGCGLQQHGKKPAAAADSGNGVVALTR